MQNVFGAGAFPDVPSSTFGQFTQAGPSRQVQLACAVTLLQSRLSRASELQAPVAQILFEPRIRVEALEDRREVVERRRAVLERPVLPLERAIEVAQPGVDVHVAVRGHVLTAAVPRRRLSSSVTLSVSMASP